MTKLSTVEGIGSSNSTKLGESGITSLENLLKTCCNKKGRKELAGKSGINEKLILNWVNRADISRIKGISTQYADLLESSGVDTVPSLALRNPKNLHSRMSEVNSNKQLVRHVPGISQVQNWVVQAKGLPRVVSH